MRQTGNDEASETAHAEIIARQSQSQLVHCHRNWIFICSASWLPKAARIAAISDCA